MKIIDFERKGNVVRFLLGEDSLENWYGDDWNDYPYECNAGTVYDQFIVGYKDIAFPFDVNVLEPSDGAYNSGWCKDDMKARTVPCIIVVQDTLDLYDRDFAKNMGRADIQKFYFGDEMDADYITKISD